MKRTDTRLDDLIASLPDEVRPDVQSLDTEISRVMAGMDRVVWEGALWGGSQQRIIGYGSYTYVGSNRKPGEWFRVGLAAQKIYISVYVNAVEDGRYLTERYAGRLGKAKLGRSNVSFKRLTDVNLDALLEMVARARDLVAGV